MACKRSSVRIRLSPQNPLHEADYKSKGSTEVGPFLFNKKATSMNYQVYILYSETLDKYYVGQTENLDQRLKSHAMKISTYTSRADDWRLVYTEGYGTRQEALKRERAIKAKKSRSYIDWLIKRVSMV
jgi:putative endonuclease